MQACRAKKEVVQEVPVLRLQRVWTLLYSCRGCGHCRKMVEPGCSGDLGVLGEAQCLHAL